MTSKKHEWRKLEKQYYLPKQKPEVADIPAFKFITVKGEGAPATAYFNDCIQALYKISYTIKMTLKKRVEVPDGYLDYAVYPLEGIWDLNDEAKKNFSGIIDKNDFVYTLMIRQPDFVDEALFHEMIALVKSKNDLPLIDELQFEEITDGKCVQMLHVGSFDSEPASFELMEEFALENGLTRTSKVHREIYLSDFRKVSEDRLKTTLRFKVDE